MIGIRPCKNAPFRTNVVVLLSTRERPGAAVWSVNGHTPAEQVEPGVINDGNHVVGRRRDGTNIAHII